MNRRPSLLLVEHAGPRKEFLIQKFVELGIEIHLATGHMEEWLSKYVPEQRVLRTDPYNSVRLLGDVTAYLATGPGTVDAVGTYWEHTVSQTADLAAALNLIGIHPGAARRSSSNKILMRQFCAQADLPTPRYRVFRNLDGLESAAAEIGMPCVVKPIFGDDSFGVAKIDQDSNLAAVIAECRETWSPKQEAFKNFPDVWMVEEYVPGPVISVDGLVQNGQIHFAGIVEISMGPEPRFTQCANFVPPRLDHATQVECFSMCQRIIQALGFDHTGFHCEMRLGPSGPVLMEIAARLPGGWIIPAYERAYGIDLAAGMMDVWLGRPVRIEPVWRKYVLQKGVNPTHPGRLKSVFGYDDVKRLKGLWEFLLVTRAGDPLVTYPSVPVPIYFYAVEADSPANLQQLADSVERTIRIETE